LPVDLLQRLKTMLSVEQLQTEEDVVRLVEARLPTRTLDALRIAGATEDETSRS